MDSNENRIELNEKIISELLKLWYDLIGQDHHKDRDCHFFIERDYCTYGELFWTVRHDGYILKDYTEEFPTFQKAQQGLIDFLIEKIAEEIALEIKNFDDLVAEGERKQENRPVLDTYQERLHKIVLSQYYDVTQQ